MTGLPKQTVGRYVNGRVPSFGNVLLIARAFDKSLSVFDDVVVEDISIPKGKSDA